MASGVSQGPTPWWQLPEYAGKRENLEKSAPSGYTYDPVKMDYVHSPTQQGQAAHEYSSAANPALEGLLAGMRGGGGYGGAGGGFAGAAGGAFGGGAGGTTTPTGGGGTGGGSSLAHVANVALPDSSASIAASMAGAKDRAGNLSRASLDALRGELGATGNLGSGAEVQGTKDIIQSGAGLIGQASRDAANKQADTAADFAKTRYGGEITQRGQDVSAQEAQARLAQEARLSEATLAFQKQQAAANQQMQMLQLALSGLKGSGGGSGLVY